MRATLLSIIYAVPEGDVDVGDFFPSLPKSHLCINRPYRHEDRTARFESCCGEVGIAQTRASNADTMLATGIRHRLRNTVHVHTRLELSGVCNWCLLHATYLRISRHSLAEKGGQNVCHLIQQHQSLDKNTRRHMKNEFYSQRNYHVSKSFRIVALSTSNTITRMA